MTSGQKMHSSAAPRKRQERETLHNRPVDLDEACWIVQVTKGDGTCETLWLDRDEVERYNADPDAYAAKEFGFVSVEEYREFAAVNGAALCSERTQAGHLCHNSIAGDFRDRHPHTIAEWRERHRMAPCRIHAKGGRP
jgi:hypothetical protein